MNYPFEFSKCYDGQARFTLVLKDGDDEVTVDGWMNPAALADPDRRWTILKGMRDHLMAEPGCPPRARDILREATGGARIIIHGTDGTN